MVIISSTMTRPNRPKRYIVQSGMAGWAGAGGGDGGDGAGGGAGAGVSFCGGGDSVVKALTALQSLEVLAPIALTFQ